MRPVLAPKVEAVEEGTAVAEKDKVVVEEGTAVAEADKLLVGAVTAVTEEDKLVVGAVTAVAEEDEGVADKDQRVAVASNYRNLTYNQLIANEPQLQILTIKMATAIENGFQLVGS
jgi:hypothetical protein